MIAVGVTNAVDMAELLLIASAPEDVLTVDDFSDLTSIISGIVANSCPERTHENSVVFDHIMLLLCSKSVCFEGRHGVA